MVNPTTVTKLRLLHELTLQKGSFEDLVIVNKIVASFEAYETLTVIEKVKANKIYRKLKLKDFKNERKSN